ncbi:hypothetical protein J0A67_01545 [Algoriphagus aestuariicola]|uniref:Outer membrane protein beta-barrel domain-containing protein n=1 Tax=Algoriphagus aestuariicola TaxID=1852016 RepID=A0ABS3BMQ7_9BACT|nr:hypothetical protein [Algoriphagus aestuariicola]MBN7799521.1 hypothetical protein [Algoriphagus aestuariicola]
MFKSIFRLAIFGWLFFGSLPVFSQTDRLSEFDWTNVDPSSGQESDFVILVSGEKVFGKIVRKYNQAFYEKIVMETGGTRSAYVPGDLKGFGLDNGQLFFSRPLPDSIEPVFIQILVSGPIELSGYKGKHFLDDGTSYRQLNAYYADVKVDGRPRNKFVKPYIFVFKSAMKGECGVALYSKIDRLPDHEEAFIDLLESYYKCQGVDYLVHVEKVPFLKLSPTAGLGLSYFSIQSIQKTEGRNDQLLNNVAYQGFIGLRLHDFRNLPRLSADFRFGYSMFSTTLLSSYEGAQFLRTASEKLEEMAIYLPASLNYSLLKNQRSEIYLGISAGVWIKQVTFSEGMIDQRFLGSGETLIQETEIAEVFDSNFLPGVKLGYNFSLNTKLRLLMELEAKRQKEYYQFSLFSNESEYSRSSISFQMGLEF